MKCRFLTKKITWLKIDGKVKKAPSLHYYLGRTSGVVIHYGHSGTCAKLRMRSGIVRK
jgi:hypothetical protein